MQNFLNLNLPDVFVYTPQKYEDKRGLFFENFNYFNIFEKKNLEFKIIQENISHSKKNVLRGLHFQKKPYSQSKIISVIKGKILDVIVDIRVGSPTFSKWVSYVLDDKANQTIYIPSGLAHGFLALEEECIVSYKVDVEYNPENVTMTKNTASSDLPLVPSITGSGAITSWELNNTNLPTGISLGRTKGTL